MSGCGSDKQWDAWLCELGKEGKLVPDGAIPSAFRGAAWRWQMALVGDFSDHQLIGRIADRPNQSALTVMNTFGPVFESGKTYVEFSLTYLQTQDLPQDVGRNGVSKFPFMITMVPPSDPAYPLLGGLITLLGAI